MYQSGHRPGLPGRLRRLAEYNNNTPWATDLRLAAGDLERLDAPSYVDAPRRPGNALIENDGTLESIESAFRQICELVKREGTAGGNTLGPLTHWVWKGITVQEIEASPSGSFSSVHTTRDFLVYFRPDLTGIGFMRRIDFRGQANAPALIAIANAL